jgi:predicted outer membrane repeat protein
MRRLASFAASISLVAGLFLVTPAPAAAVVNTIYVGSADDSSPASNCADPDFTTYESSMEVALAAAIVSVDTDGDEIVICNGTYVYEASIAWLEQENDFAIVAEKNGGVTLDGGNSYGLLAVAGDASLEIVGIRFIRASETGAIYRPWGNLFVIESEFVGNNKRDDAGFSDFGGGAINGDGGCGYFHQIERSVFRSNSGPDGAVATCDVMVAESTFVNNTSRASGGALYVCGLAVIGSYFARNTAKERGGAIDACFIDDMDDSRFERNVARQNGGAVHVWDPMEEPDDWTGNSFVANRAKSGGAIFMGCRPANSRALLSHIRRNNQMHLNSGGGVEFNRESCDI